MREIKPTERLKGEKISLEVEHPRVRDGCDYCHKDPPTECFIGFRGHVLWVCERCILLMTRWENVPAKKAGE